MKNLFVIVFLMVGVRASADHLSPEQAAKLSGKYERVRQKIVKHPEFSCRGLTVNIQNEGQVTISFDGNFTDSTKSEISIPHVIYNRKKIKNVSHDESTDSGDAAVRGDRTVEIKNSSIRVADSNTLQLDYYEAFQASDLKLLFFGRQPRYMNNEEWHNYKANLSNGTITYRSDTSQNSDRALQIECIFKKVNP